MQSQESEVTILISNNFVSDTDLVDAYVETWSKLLDHFNSSSLQNKQVVAVDISLKEIVNNEATISITSNLGSLGQNLSQNLVDIRTNCDVFDDDWLGGDSAGNGRCDGTNSSSNAALELEKVINKNYRIENPLISPYPNAAIHVGFIEIEGWSKMANQYFNFNDVVEFDNHRDFLMWETDPTIDLDPNVNEYEFYKCIPEEDMDWYYCNIMDIIIPDIIVSGPGILSGYEFISLTMDIADIPITGVDPSTPWILHRAIVSYGIPIWTSDNGGRNPNDGPFVVTDLSTAIKNPCPEPPC